jgi:rod shape-determining protein MreC
MNPNGARDRVRWVTLLVLVGVTILLVVLDSTGSLDSAFELIESPFSSLLKWSSARTDAVVDSLSTPQDLQVALSEIDQLRSQVDNLQRENAQLREIQGEYQLLQDLFDRARESPEFGRQMASIIGYDTSPLFRSIIIDKGSDDGVLVGMPVESARGLVGQVFRTSAHSAMVILITDNISSIPARLDASRATGIVRGGGLGGAMTMDWIGLEEQVAVGEVVLTSGLGGKFPQDMVIGRVVDLEKRESDLFQRAVIQPAVDFNALELLFVITDFREIDTSIFDTIPDDLVPSP